MTEEEIAALLGRSLTALEVTNFDKYLSIATEQLETLLCISTANDSGERTYESRSGYKTLFPDVFTEVNSITLNGTEVDADDYRLEFFGDRNKDFYNSIVFSTKLTDDEVVIDAEWGFETLPDDLQELLAQLFALTAKKKAIGSVKSKRVEDFQITYGDVSDYNKIVDDNEAIISKYGMCSIGNTRHGNVCSLHSVANCYNCGGF